MIATARWMREARLLNIQGTAAISKAVPSLGTEVRTIPHARFVEEFRRQEADSAVRSLAATYRKRASRVDGPSKEDILEAARAYAVLKALLAAEEADALTMECLTGLRIPHQHPPPCMGFMSLRDEGIAAGCQAELNPALTLMLIQRLFDKPGFQQNAAMNTAKNLYFGSHCTAPSKMRGRSAAPEHYTLHHHAEAGWGCVPRVLFTPGQEVTMALYQSGAEPQMLVYSGRIVDCPPIPPTGGCRSNLQMTINEVSDVCDVKGMHQIIFYGNHAAELRAFCQLHGIPVVT
jgi:L-fucose isomerase-like protein